MNPDHPLIRWPCYEPASYCAELTETDLLQHVLVAGSTGSGKTTLLTAATKQLIGHQAGLLLLDAKVDGMVEQVRTDARKFGREHEVMVFGPEGDHGFDLFGGLRTLDDVGRMTRRLMLGIEPLGRDNTYWQQATNGMVGAALALLVMGGKAVTFESAVRFMRRWFFWPETPSEVGRLTERMKSQSHRPAIEAALDQVQMWRALDARTRSNLQSCLMNVLQPLASPAAMRCFDSGNRSGGTPAQAATEGKLCVVSVSALTEPDLARFFFRLAKQEFFDAVQRRQGGNHRLCGLVADEFPLVVTAEDVEQLGTVRSKRCFVLAATQGLDGITRRLGIVAGRAIINHFNTAVLMRTREAETALFAFLGLGMRTERVKCPKQTGPRWEAGSLLSPSPTPPEQIEVAVCPIGGLARLAPHQAFILFPDGRRTEYPVWFVPWFEEPQPLFALATEVTATADSFFTASHVERLMEQAGFKRQWPPEVVTQAIKLSRRRNQKRRLNEVAAFFRSEAAMAPAGLDTLAMCWLAALPGILRKLKKPHWTHLSFLIDRVAVKDGLLLLHFAQEQPNPEGRLTAWDRIRIAVNASLYPSAWRPLSPRHRQRLGLIKSPGDRNIPMVD